MVFFIPTNRQKALFRLDPCESSGAVHIQKIAIFKESEPGTRRCLDGADLLSCSGCRRLDGEGLAFAAYCDPGLLFRLPEDWADARVTVELELTHSADIACAFSNLIDELDAIKNPKPKQHSGSWFRKILRRIGWR
jgi:hypothetical protein